MVIGVCFVHCKLVSGKIYHIILKQSMRERQIVENQYILMFPRQGPLILNCLNTSCVRKDKEEFIATSICEVLDSF